MSVMMDQEIKRWTTRRKSALVLEIIRGKTAVAEASRQCDLTPSEIQDGLDQRKAGMENALKFGYLTVIGLLDMNKYPVQRIFQIKVGRYASGRSAAAHGSRHCRQSQQRQSFAGQQTCAESAAVTAG